MSFHFLFTYFSFYFFFNAFLPKITLGPWQGVGVGGCSFVGMATGPKSDVQWAKKWRTVGQNVTYAGLKSDVPAKMQHWSVIMHSMIWQRYYQSEIGGGWTKGIICFAKLRWDTQAWRKICLQVIKSPQYTGGDFMFLYRFVRRRRRLRRRRRRPQILVHAITFEQLFGFLSFLAQLLALTYRLPD